MQKRIGNRKGLGVRGKLRGTDRKTGKEESEKHLSHR